MMFDLWDVCESAGRLDQIGRSEGSAWNYLFGLLGDYFRFTPIKIV